MRAGGARPRMPAPRGPRPRSRTRRNSGLSLRARMWCTGRGARVRAAPRLILHAGFQCCGAATGARRCRRLGMKCTPCHTCHHAGEARRARRCHSPRILGDLPTAGRGRPGRRDLHAGWRGSRLHLEFRGGAHQGVPGGGDRRAAFLALLPFGGRGRGKAGAAARDRGAGRPGGRSRVAGAEGRRPLLGRGDHYGQAGFRGGGDRVRQGDPRLDRSQGNAGRAASERTDVPAPGREHPGLRHFHARPRRAGRQLERRCGAHPGVPRPRDMGEHFSTFYPPDDVAQGKPQWALEIAEREGRHEDEGWRVRKDGTRFWANSVISPMRDSQGGLIGYAKVTRDLTQRRRADQALAQTNQELERFSYSVSHDLRAPLRAINGYAQALWEDHAARLDDEGKRLLAVIRDSAKLGGQLIDGLLSFSRLGRQALARAPVDVTALAESVVAELRQTQGSVAVEVVLSPLPPASGDAALLRHVLVNLIDNAFKFSAKRAHPKVEIGAEQHGSEVAYYVKDNGVG